MSEQDMVDSSKPNSFPRDKRMISALDDAMFLIEHASLNGIKIPNDVLNGILNMNDRVDEQSVAFSLEEIKAFWEANSKLSALMPDINALSLKAIKKTKTENLSLSTRLLNKLLFKKSEGSSNISDAQKTTRIYRHGAILWLLFLIAGQTYWIVVKDLYNACKVDLPNKIAVLESDNDSILFDVSKTITRASVIRDLEERMVNRAGIAPPLQKIIDKKINQYGSEQKAYAQIIEQLQKNILGVELESLVNKEREERIYRWIYGNSAVFDDNFRKMDELIGHLHLTFENLEDYTHFSIFGDDLEVAEELSQQRPRIDSVNMVFSTWKSEVKEIGHYYERPSLNRSKIILSSLSQFIFPLLFGIMGAYLYILRELQRSINMATFLPENQIGFRVRLVLGALAGLAIGFFLGSGDEGTFSLSNLSPLTVSFLVGYSVDLLFTTMDTMIKRLTGTQS